MRAYIGTLAVWREPQEPGPNTESHNICFSAAQRPNYLQIRLPFELSTTGLLPRPCIYRRSLFPGPSRAKNPNGLALTLRQSV